MEIDQPEFITQQCTFCPMGQSERAYCPLSYAIQVTVNPDMSIDRVNPDMIGKFVIGENRHKEVENIMNDI